MFREIRSTPFPKQIVLCLIGKRYNTTNNLNIINSLINIRKTKQFYYNSLVYIFTMLLCLELYNGTIFNHD